MTRFQNLQARTKIAILTGLVSFLFSLILIVLEDQFEIVGTKRIFRIYLGFSFSVITAFMTYYAVNLFYSTIRNISLYLRNWVEGEDDDFEYSEKSEVGKILRAVKLALFQKLEIIEEEFTRKLQDQKIDFIKKVHTRILEKKTPKVEYVDISLFPKHTTNPDSGLIGVYGGKSGAWGTLLHFRAPDIEEGITKVELHGAMTLSEKIDFPNPEDYIHSMNHLLQSIELPHLSGCLFGLNSEDGGLNYLLFQETPILILRDGVVLRLESDIGSQYPNEEEIFPKVEYLSPLDQVLIISDQAFHSLDHDRDDFGDWLEESFSHKEYPTSRDLALDVVQFFHDHHIPLSSTCFAILRWVPKI
jgi:Arg-Lys translocation region protein phosphatase